VTPTPETIYARGVVEGRRRLAMSWLDLVATGFVAGVTIVFGVVAMSVVEALLEPDVGSGVARVVGALAFATGLVFLVVGRSELFTEDFFDPVAAAIEDGRLSAGAVLLRLWAVTLAFNLVGGSVLAAALVVDRSLPEGVPAVLTATAEEIVGRSWSATLVRAVFAGALITLLSYMLDACDSVSSRIAVATMVGFTLALGPFEHVVVTVLHVLLGWWLGASVVVADVAFVLLLTTVGNLVGGLLLITLTHTAQVKGERH
jgi:formate/nitrite transporter FocA (FNT family)